MNGDTNKTLLLSMFPRMTMATEKCPCNGWNANAVINKTMKYFLPPTTMNKDVKELCDRLLTDLDVPSFIVFGYKTESGTFRTVTSYKKCPTSWVIKGLSHFLNALIQKKM